MDQIGTVKDIKNNKAIVSIKRPSACGENCAGCTLSCDVKQVNIELDTIDGINIGDSVEIVSENVNILKLSAILYGIPLAIMVTTIAFFWIIFQGKYQLISGLLGISSLIVSSIILKKYEEKVTKTKGPVFTITRKVDSENEL